MSTSSLRALAASLLCLVAVGFYCIRLIAAAAAVPSLCLTAAVYVLSLTAAIMSMVLASVG